MNNKITALPVFRLGCRSILPLLSALLIVCAAFLTVCMQEHVGIYADAGSISGAPTLSAATVNQIFARVGSPMTGAGAAVEQAARATNIDDAFALAVWWTETNDGEAGVGLADNNPGSVRGEAGFPAAYDGYTIYPSYTAAIKDWFQLLRTNYLNRGYTTVYAISNPYVGTAGSPIWAGKVVSLMARYHGQFPQAVSIAPAPTPTGPTPRRLLVNHRTYILHRAIPLPAETELHHSVREWSVGEKATQPLPRQQQKGTTPASTGTSLSALLTAGNSIKALQAPIMSTLIALLSLSIVILGLRRRRLTTATTTTTAHTTAVPVIELTTERLSLKSIKDAMRPVPPTPQLVAMGAVPLTPFMHYERVEMETEGFSLPQNLRHTDQAKQRESKTGIARYSTRIDGIAVKTGGLALPDRRYSEVGVQAEGLLSRYRDNEQKNASKNC